MSRVNRYYRRSRIAEAKFRQLLRYFALDLTATDTAELLGLERKTVTAIYLKLRGRLADAASREHPWMAGEVEVDESYFGPRRVRGKRGRGASGKTPVIGLRKRAGRVYAEVVPNCTKAALQAVIRGHVPLESVIHSDGWRGYDGLVDIGYAKHFRVQHEVNEFVRSTDDGLGAVQHVTRVHVNGIESFWSFAKHRLMQFHGIAPHTFHLHLKECEWRFNTPRAQRYAALLRLLRTHPL